MLVLSAIEDGSGSLSGHIIAKNTMALRRRRLIVFARLKIPAPWPSDSTAAGRKIEPQPACPPAH